MVGQNHPTGTIEPLRIAPRRAMERKAIVAAVGHIPDNMMKFQAVNL